MKDIVTLSEIESHDLHPCAAGRDFDPISSKTDILYFSMHAEVDSEMFWNHF